MNTVVIYSYTDLLLDASICPLGLVSHFICFAKARWESGSRERERSLTGRTKMGGRVRETEDGKAKVEEREKEKKNKEKRRRE